MGDGFDMARCRDSLKVLISRVACCLNGRDLARQRVGFNCRAGREFPRIAGAVQEHGRQAELLAKVFEEMGGLDTLVDLDAAIADRSRQGRDGETRLDPKDDSAGPKDIAQTGESNHG